MPPAIGDYSVYDYDAVLLNAAEFMDNVIADRSIKIKRFWFDMIPRGSFKYGQGIVRKMHRFYPGLSDQAGLTTWNQVRLSIPEDGETPESDACTHEAEVLSSAFETVEYTGYETERQTDVICLKDIKYRWEFTQQLNLMMGWLADASLDVWENMGREAYLKFCADASQIYVAARGVPDATTLSSTYNPFTSSDVVIPRDIDVSMLDWSIMEWWHQYLSIQAPTSAVGQVNNMPVWGLVIHPMDFSKMIDQNDDLKETFRYHDTNVLVENYGYVKAYKGFNLFYDMYAPRYKVKEIGATTQTLERVVPYTTEATTKGNKKVINSDYINAEYAMGIIFVKSVCKHLVPPAVPGRPGGNTEFGVLPNLMGDFHWLNIQDREENPYREKGNFVARYEDFLEPGENSLEPIAFIYRRCPKINYQSCDPCDGDTIASTAWATITSATEVPAGDSTYNQVDVTLDGCLACEAPAEISVSYAGDESTDVTAVMTRNAGAPTYRLTFATSADWIDAAAIVANTTQVRCA